jgi:hypothetical protein
VMAGAFSLLLSYLRKQESPSNNAPSRLLSLNEEQVRIPALTAATYVSSNGRVTPSDGYSNGVEDVAVMAK